MRKVELLAVVLILLGAAATLRAQTATGQINGTVRDTTGAVVPGAKVTITEPSKGISRTATTDANGDYVFALLSPGTYSVQAELQGFSIAKESDIQLFVDNFIRVDLTLTLGEMTESVDVEAPTVTLQSESANIGQTLSERQITELPLNGRNFLELLFLQAGAVESTGEQGTMRQGVGNAISIQGARPTSNNFMIDGTTNLDTNLGTPAVILSPDAMEEFTQQNKTYSAQYGFSANQINLVSKSGSNEFHGTGFYFARNEAWDARNFFDPPDAEKPELDQKQFGGTIGGPIIKDKTFFLFNYEGLRVDNGSSRFGIVPTADELAGHFSQTIIDPVTGQPFPNNTIPQDRYSRMAQVAVQNGWFPAPNVDLPQGNYQEIRTLPRTQNQYNVRIDQNLGQYGRVFARFTRTTYDDTSAGSFTAGIGDNTFSQEATQWQVSHTWPIQSNIVNFLRVGHVEASAIQSGAVPCAPADVDALGLTGVWTDIPDPQRGCPGFNIQGYGRVGGDVNDYTYSNQPMWDISNTTTWVMGDHTLTFGANYRRWWLQRDTAADLLGDFPFNVGFTGNVVADFLLGYYSGGTVFQPGPFSAGVVGNPYEFNYTYFAPYIQDDWRVNSKLTLNLGLRWDYRSVPYETDDHFAWRNPDYAPGGLLVADESLVRDGIVDGAYYQLAGRRSPENPDRFKVFAPRISFAYRPFESRETVIRGGYGIFYDAAETREIDGAAAVYPYVSRGNYQQTINQAEPLQTTDALFPSFATPGVVTPASNGLLAVNQSPEPRNPYVQQWSLGIQHMVHRTTTVELNYVGSHGSNLLMRINVAQAVPYTPESPTVAERRPFANFGTYIDSIWEGYSDYHAMNVVATHRSRNLVATAAYTWGKSTDSKSAAGPIGAQAFNGWQGFLDNHDPERDHGLSDFDVAHRFVASFVWNLPFGNGERWGADATGAKQALIGGWQLNGIWLWGGGMPITIQAADIGGVLDSFGTNRADIVGDIHSGGGTIDQWFNPAAFAQPAFGEFGNSGRNILRGPGINNLDLSLFKNFFVGPTTLQFRVEAFNVLNHPNFLGVATNLTAPNFGVVTSARDGRIVQLGAKLIF
jgi:outer membrane receptor protein involved in Fe transport